jgi:hypothetical protein
MKSGKGNGVSGFDALSRALLNKKAEPMAPLFCFPALRLGLLDRGFTPSNFSVESEALLCNNSMGRICIARRMVSQISQFKIWAWRGKSSWVFLGLQLDSKG